MNTEIPTRKELGKRLQRLRKAHGFKSAAAFAEYAGLSVTAYTEYEQGRNPISLERAWLIADALGCSLDELGGRTTSLSTIEYCYVSLNDTGQDVLLSVAKSMVNDPANAKKGGTDNQAAIA